MLSYLTIIRPLNCLITAIAVLLGFLTACSVNETFKITLLLFAVSASFLITAFGNVINDIVDVDIDLINRPNRPIPSGAISKRWAVLFTVSLLFSGLLLGSIISRFYLFITLLPALLLFIYSFYLKRRLLSGNIVVGLLTSFALIYGGLLSAGWKHALIPAAFAFLINFAREIVKDIIDMEGDSKVHANTLPLKYGKKIAIIVSVCILSLLIVLTPFPYILKIYDLKYLIAVVLFVDVPLVFFVISSIRKYENISFMNRFSSALKFIMIFGIVAVIIGKNIWK